MLWGPKYHYCYFSGSNIKVLEFCGTQGTRVAFSRGPTSKYWNFVGSNIQGLLFFPGSNLKVLECGGVQRTIFASLVVQHQSLGMLWGPKYHYCWSLRSNIKVLEGRGVQRTSRAELGVQHKSIGISRGPTYNSGLFSGSNIFLIESNVYV